MLKITMSYDESIHMINEISLASKDGDTNSSINVPLLMFVQLLHAAGYSREVIASRFIEVASCKNYDAIVDRLME